MTHLRRPVDHTEWTSWTPQATVVAQLQPLIARACQGDPVTAWQQLVGFHAFGFAVAPEDGGLGFGHEAMAMVCREVGAANLPLPVVDTALAASSGPRLAGEALAGHPVVFASLCLPGNNASTGSWCLTGVEPAVVVSDLGARRVLDPPDVTLVPAGPMAPACAHGIHINAMPGDRLTSDPVDDPDLWRTAALYQAALLVGLSAAALARATRRMRSRRQFGAALGEHQSPRLDVAAMFATQEMVELAMCDAARAHDAARFTDAAARSLLLLCADTARTVARTATHLHGAAGLRTDAGLGDIAIRLRWESTRLGPTGTLGRRVLVDALAAFPEITDV